MENLKGSLARLPKKIRDDYELKRGDTTTWNDLANLVAGYGRDFDTELTTLKLVAENHLADVLGLESLLDVCKCLATVEESISEMEEYMRRSALGDIAVSSSKKEIGKRIEKISAMAANVIMEIIKLIKAL